MQRKQDKDSWLTMFLSNIFPGIGHFYINKIWIGISCILIALIAGSAFPLLITIIIDPIVAAIIAYSAFRSTPSHRTVSKKLAIRVLVTIIILSYLFATIAFITRTWLFESRYIPSSAMEPTIQINDKLFVEKLSYHSQVPKRGDIIIFSPTESLKAQNFHDAGKAYKIFWPLERQGKI